MCFELRTDRCSREGARPLTRDGAIPQIISILLTSACSALIARNRMARGDILGVWSLCRASLFTGFFESFSDPMGPSQKCRIVAKVGFSCT